ncbi:MAG: dockerin type I repeat-containing protein [candidate division Zixibacteria bacterium]|nr:dockerin type I repeat-containing protein [candidate division Zixibacteria bacterium]
MRTLRLVTVVLALGLMMGVQVDARAEIDLNSTSFDRSTLGQVLASPDLIVDPPVNWPMYYGVQQTGEIVTRFDCYGGFGGGFGLYPNWSGWPTGWFEAPPDNGAEYLFAGAIWVGGIVGDDTLVSTAMDGWISINEMYPDGNQPAVTKVSYPTDYSMRAEFSDTSVELGGVDYEDGSRPHIPLNIRMVNRSHIWRTEPENRTVIYDLILTNTGDEEIHDGYVGFYMDCDVCYECSGFSGYSDDITGTLRSEGIAYTIDNDGDLASPDPEILPVPRAFGFKFLASTFDAVDTNFNWWLSNGTPPLDFGPRLKGTPTDPFRDFGTGGFGTPDRDDNKYYILSHPEWDYDQVMTASIEPSDPTWLYPNQFLVTDFTDGYDTRFLMSLGPFDLAPGQSHRLLYATFTSSDVHSDPDNIDNLPDNPETYLAGLDLSSLITNGDLSDSLAGVLLDASLPPIGLRAVYEDVDEVVVQWDPWCFDNIYGNRVYLSEVPPDSLPYPGVPAPWLRPSELNQVAYLNSDQTSYTFDNLEPQKIYFVNVAHEAAKGTGEVCDPVFVKLTDPTFAPQFEIEYSFYEEGQPVVLNWSTPEGATIDHYNVYRFDSSLAAARKYHSFYDEGFHAATIPPMDSFFIDGKTYYYYAMEPYATVTPSKMTFTDYDVQEDRVYVVTAVDEYGFESEFSIDVSAVRVEPRTQDILIVTHSIAGGPHTMNYDSVVAFYDEVLQGYDYDIYDWSDSSASYYGIGYVDWHDFTRYRLVIVDDDIRGKAINSTYELATAGYTKYILSGGKLSYFGSFPAILGLNFSDNPGYHAAEPKFLQRFFGIDSIFFVGGAYFYHNSLPMVDSIFAFSSAQPLGPGLPPVAFDAGTNRFSDLMNGLWPTDDSPPSVSVIGVNETGVTTHLFEPISGVSSMNAGQPVGVRTLKENSDTYLFGFHLWYMELEGARALIDAMLLDPPMVITEPDTLWAYYAHDIDTMILSIYLGNFSDGYNASDIEMSSVRLDGDMEPMGWELLGGYPGFDGEVVRFDFSVTEFIERLGPFYGTSQYLFPLAGFFSDRSSFSTIVTLTMAGKIPGDINGDGQVDIADLVYLVTFIFLGGPEPAGHEEACDLDGDGTCGVADITYMVSFLYLGGPAPVE